MNSSGFITFINDYPECQHCNHVLHFDLNPKACSHACAFCFAHPTQANLKYYPFDLPKIFEETFSTGKRNIWSSILLKRFPLRIGGLSDPLAPRTSKDEDLLEILHTLKRYNYPYFIVTRSDRVANPEIIEALDPTLASIQISIPSLNAELAARLEPGAPAPSARLNAIRKLSAAGIHVQARISPIIPQRPDGYFSEKKAAASDASFDYFSFDLPEVLADAGVKGIIAEFCSTDERTLSRIEKAAGVTLDWLKNSPLGEEERNYYFDRISETCRKRNVPLNFCYLGLPEIQYFKLRKKNSNSMDCCNLAGNLESFKKTSYFLSDPFLPWWKKLVARFNGYFFQQLSSTSKSKK